MTRFVVRATQEIEQENVAQPETEFVVKSSTKPKEFGTEGLLQSVHNMLSMIQWSRATKNPNNDIQADLDFQEESRSWRNLANLSGQGTRKSQEKEPQPHHMKNLVKSG